MICLPTHAFQISNLNYTFYPVPRARLRSKISITLMALTEDSETA